MRELGVQEKEGYFSNVYELPDGAVQLYVRDPSGNMVEVNRPDVSTLDRSVVGEIEKLDAGESVATLYLPRQPGRLRDGRSRRSLAEAGLAGADYGLRPVHYL